MGSKSSEFPKKTSFDLVKWGFIFLLIAVSLWANYQYSQIDWPLRLAGWIVLACLLLAIASQTVVGQKVWQFSKQARGELRKVVWPTRQETVQTTLIIIGLVVLTSLILWGIDSILLWLVSLLTGQGQ